MRLGGLFLLLILSYLFNPIEPLVNEVEIDVSHFEQLDAIETKELDASLKEFSKTQAIA